MKDNLPIIFFYKYVKYVYGIDRIEFFFSKQMKEIIYIIYLSEVQLKKKYIYHGNRTVNSWNFVINICLINKK